MTVEDLDLLARRGRSARRSRLSRLIRKVGHIGTAGYDPTVARRLAITNIIALMGSFMLVPYVVLCALYDFSGLKPAILLFLGQFVLTAMTPFYHRFGSSAAATNLAAVWLAFGVACGFLFGRDAGLHLYFLPGAAASMLVFGAGRMGVSAFLTLLALAAFLVVEIAFTAPAGFIAVDRQFLSVLFYVTVPLAFLLVFMAIFFIFRQAEQSETALEREYAFSEKLLENILPKTVATRLKNRQDKIVADQIDDATILFADIVNFTPRASRWQPHEALEFLSRVFRGFDELAARHGLEEIKTIGDAYMVAGGLPEPRADHAEAVASMALDILDFCRRLSDETGEDVEVRIGIGSGPVVAGVIGSRKLLYDVWGDTVNTAARMEAQSFPGRIQVPDRLKQKLEGSFTFEPRGDIAVKGKGLMKVWFLTGRRLS